MANELDRELGMLYETEMARERGLAEGLEEGRQEERAKTINRLMASGMTLETISQLLDIPLEECLMYTSEAK